MAKLVLNENAPINEVRLAGFYWTNISRDGEGTNDKAQVFIRMVYGREVNGVFQQFGSRHIAIEPADYGGALTNLLGNIETAVLNRLASLFGGHLV